MRIGIPARRIVVGRRVLAILSSVVRGPIPLVAICMPGSDLRPIPLVPVCLVLRIPVVHHDPVRRRPLIVVLRRAMPAATLLVMLVRRAMPAAPGLVVPVVTLLGVAIPGPVPTAGAPLLAGLVDTRDVQQRSRIRRPLDRHQEPTDLRPALPPVDGRRDLLGEGPVLRRGISLRRSVAHRRSGYCRAVTRRSAAVLWPRAAGARCIHACGELRLGNLRGSDRRQSNRRWSGRDGWHQGRGRNHQRRTGSLEPLVRHRPAARAEDDGHGSTACEQPRRGGADPRVPEPCSPVLRAEQVPDRPLRRPHSATMRRHFTSPRVDRRRSCVVRLSRGVTITSTRRCEIPLLTRRRDHHARRMGIELAPVRDPPSCRGSALGRLRWSSGWSRGWDRRRTLRVAAAPRPAGAPAPPGARRHGRGVTAASGLWRCGSQPRLEVPFCLSDQLRGASADHPPGLDGRGRGFRASLIIRRLSSPELVRGEQSPAGAPRRRTRRSRARRGAGIEPPPPPAGTG
jgi:hypothetical protein